MAVDSCMIKKRIRTNCNDSGLSKLIYLTSMTFLTAGFIIECIMLHLMLTPYMEEELFMETKCTYNHSSKTPNNSNKDMVKCENRCTKDNSRFPCVFIKVSYNKVNSTNSENDGYLYDYYRTYVRYKSKRCTTSPCNLLASENRDWVISFNRTLFNKQKFTCYYHTKDLTSVLLYKLYPKELMLHCIVWPAVIFLLGLIGIFFTGLCAGCDVWQTEDVVIA